MTHKIPQSGEFCWNELLTNDPKKAKQFYTELLGWETHDMNINDIVYTLIKAGDRDIGGIMQTPQSLDHDTPSRWLSYITVDSVDDMVKKAQKLGATVKVPGMDISDYGRIAVIVDPTGAEIAFWQSLKECK